MISNLTYFFTNNKFYIKIEYILNVYSKSKFMSFLTLDLKNTAYSYSCLNIVDG